MRIISMIMGLSLALLLGFAMRANAIMIEYTGGDPNYQITNVTSEEAHAVVTELYGAQNLIPSTDLGFTSHDGYAVVDLAPTGGTLLFDKTITIDDPNDIRRNFQMTFNIVNTSPFTWSDYHISLSNPVGPGATLPTITFAQSADFKNASFTDSTADWDVNAPGSKLIAPVPSQGQEVLHLNFALDTSNLVLGENFTLSQIATAEVVPVPSSLPLFGSALLGLALMGWRRRMRS